VNCGRNWGLMTSGRTALTVVAQIFPGQRY